MTLGPIWIFLHLNQNDTVDSFPVLYWYKSICIRFRLWLWRAGTHSKCLLLHLQFPSRVSATHSGPSAIPEWMMWRWLCLMQRHFNTVTSLRLGGTLTITVGPGGICICFWLCQSPGETACLGAYVSHWYHECTLKLVDCWGVWNHRIISFSIQPVLRLSHANYLASLFSMADSLCIYPLGGVWSPFHAPPWCGGLLFWLFWLFFFFFFFPFLVVHKNSLSCNHSTLSLVKCGICHLCARSLCRTLVGVREQAVWIRWNLAGSSHADLYQHMPLVPLRLAVSTNNCPSKFLSPFSLEIKVFWS